MKNTTKKVVGRGRPVTTAWSKANFLWKNKTNKEIADFLGCSAARVCQKRQELTAKAEQEGKPQKYESRRKWARTLQTA